MDKVLILKNALIQGIGELLPISVKLAGDTINKLYGKDIKGFLGLIEKENFVVEKTDTICIELNRKLTEEELSKFFHSEEAFEKMYSYCDIEFSTITPDIDSMKEMDIDFQEEIPVKEAAKFAVFLNKYIRDLGKGLWIETVYAYISDYYIGKLVDEATEGE